MKKLMALTLVGLGMLVVLNSCGSSRGGHCDAYGKVDVMKTETTTEKI